MATHTRHTHRHRHAYVNMLVCQSAFNDEPQQQLFIDLQNFSPTEHVLLTVQIYTFRNGKMLPSKYISPTYIYNYLAGIRSCFAEMYVLQTADLYRLRRAARWVCCRVLPCVAVCCRVLPCIAVHYSVSLYNCLLTYVLQWVDACGSVWQCVASCGRAWPHTHTHARTNTRTHTHSGDVTHLPAPHRLLQSSPPHRSRPLLRRRQCAFAAESAPRITMHVRRQTYV